MMSVVEVKGESESGGVRFTYKADIKDFSIECSRSTIGEAVKVMIDELSKDWVSGKKSGNGRYVGNVRIMGQTGELKCLCIFLKVERASYIPFRQEVHAYGFVVSVGGEYMELPESFSEWSGSRLDDIADWINQQLN